MKKPGLITILIFLSFVTFSQEKRVLSLEECIDIAVENNLSVQRSELNLNTSEINLMQAQAQRYPTLNANGSFGLNWGRNINPATNLFIDQRIESHDLNANSTLSIINGFQITNSIKQGKLDVEASKYDLKKTVNDISLNTASFYLTVIFNKELLENAESQLESSQQQLDRTNRLVESGALPLANKLQLESQVATNEVSLINSQNNLDLALLSLKQALLLPPGEDIDVIIPDITINQAEIEESSIRELYEEAATNMPEIQSADLKMQSADIGLKVSKGAAYPILNLNASAGTRYSDAANQPRVFFSDTESTLVANEIGFLTANPSQTVSIVSSERVITGSDSNFSVIEQYSEFMRTTLSLSLRIPILNGFQTKGNIQKSKISVQQAGINKREQENTLYQTIETSYRNAVAAAKTHSASQKQVASLEETLRAVENQYTNGAANFTDYQVASNNLFQAKTDLSRAKYDFIFKQKLLEFYQGKLLTF